MSVGLPAIMSGRFVVFISISMPEPKIIAQNRLQSYPSKSLPTQHSLPSHLIWCCLPSKIGTVSLNSKESVISFCCSGSYSILFCPWGDAVVEALSVRKVTVVCEWTRWWGGGAGIMESFNPLSQHLTWKICEKTQSLTGFEVGDSGIQGRTLITTKSRVPNHVCEACKDDDCLYCNLSWDICISCVGSTVYEKIDTYYKDR